MRGLTQQPSLDQRATRSPDHAPMDDAVRLEPVDDLRLEPLLLLEGPRQLGLERTNATAEQPDLGLSPDHGVASAPHVGLQLDVRLLVRADDLSEPGHLA